MAEVLSCRLAEADEGLVVQACALTEGQWPSDPPLDPVEKARGRVAEARAYTGDPERAAMMHFVVEGDRVLAAARTFARTIDTTAGGMTIMALGGVIVEETRRGNGYGRDVVRAAFERVDRGVFGFSLFQTGTHNRGFYAKLGAMYPGNRVINSLDERGPESPAFNVDELVVVYPEREGWPAGTIDLLGPGY
ncbi:GNAT family N-acetyltransferase [Mucisphaera calidilacus]|uniref:N-acetyltransferase domain-containing protein n=1 Tax=Mucisphaera calidilacus TaxID=2527982 RepID=A0A518BZA9_9BACT|nr:GNAT family N-acetyltransferase [Mucisphaera calidilacus]QDU72295.1 hypothetical protein Pan265_21590 [Mucisphaera calidilacus]